MKARQIVAVGAAVLALSAGTAACKDSDAMASPFGTGSSSGSSNGQTAPHAAWQKYVVGDEVKDFATNLASLRTDAGTTGAGYDRDLFPHWDKLGKKVNGKPITAQTLGHWPNGIATNCDSRKAALIRDGQDVQVKKSSCKVTSGKWENLYADTSTVTSPTKLDIDHIVPLSYAFRHGVKPADRELLANDPMNLTISNKRENEQAKGDDGPSDYMPKATFECPYAARFAAVASHYSITVTKPDLATLRSTGVKCGFIKK